MNYYTFGFEVQDVHRCKYFLSRQLRNRSVRRQQKNTENADTPTDKRSKDLKPTEHFSMSVYDQAEAKPAYQELGGITEEYQYEKLSWQDLHTTRVYNFKNTLIFVNMYIADFYRLGLDLIVKCVKRVMYQYLQ